LRFDRGAYHLNWNRLQSGGKSLNSILSQQLTSSWSKYDMAVDVAKPQAAPARTPPQASQQREKQQPSSDGTVERERLQMM